MNILSNFIKKKIKSFLSGYLQDNERKPIELELASDELILKNVYLNTEELNKNLNELPVRIIEGGIQNLMIKIPWSNLFSSALEIQIDDIVVILELKDASNNPQELLFSREIALKKLFESFKAHVLKQITLEEPPSQTSFMSNIKNKIIDNLQLKLSNVAFLLQVPFGLSKPTFQIEIQEFNFFTTDAKFEHQVFFDRNLPQFKNSPISKMVKLDNFTFSIADSNTELLENYSGNLKNKVDYKNVFKINLNINARIKTTDIEDNQPKFWCSISISMIKFNLTERKINHIFELLDLMQNFNRELDMFYNYYMQKPKLRMTEIRNSKPEFKNILAKRWWIYCTMLVLKDLHVKKKEDAWKQLKTKIIDQRKKFKNMRIPHFILSQFKEPVRNILEELLQKNWNVHGIFSNDERMFDLETILFFIPENQLKQLVNQTCGSIIRLEQKKEKGVSFAKKLLNKLGLYKAKPKTIEMVKFLEENVIKDENFEQKFQFKIELQFSILKINVMTEYESVFSIETSGFECKIEKYVQKLDAIVSFKNFRFFFKSLNSIHNIFYSNKSERNFIDCNIHVKNDGKVNVVKGKINIQSTCFEIRKEIFDEIFLFLRNKKNRQTRASDINAYRVASLGNQFEKTLKDMQTDIDLAIEMDSMAFELILDSNDKRKIILNTGKIKTKVLMTNSSTNYNYLIEINNMGLDYFLNSSKHSIIDLSLYGNILTQNNISFKIWLISKEVEVNVKPVLIYDMLNSIAVFKEQNIKTESQTTNKVLKEYSTKYMLKNLEDSYVGSLTEETFTDAMIQINKNKTIGIFNKNELFTTQTFNRLNFRYYRKFGKYLLKVKSKDSRTAKNTLFYFRQIRGF